MESVSASRAAFAAAGARLNLLADDRGGNDVEARALACEGHVADITDAAAVERVVAAMAAIDVLVNNAGLERITPLDEPGRRNRGSVPAHRRDQYCRRHIS